ncbi:MAG: hypothetical protein ACK47M_19550 [Caldilinea sp.]
MAAYPVIEKALQAWDRADSPAAHSKAAQGWMRAIEQVKQDGGDVSKANSQTRKRLGDGDNALMRQVGIEAQRRRER